MKRILLCLMCLLFMTVSVSSSLAQTAAEPPIIQEARAFMDGYAEDLRSGNRAGIAARYDAAGAWIVQYGAAMAVTHDQVIDRYATAWEPPAAFAWRDLVFVPAGSESVTVIGRFDWTTAGRETDRTTYNGLLVRTANGLRIRIEDEVPIPNDIP